MMMFWVSLGLLATVSAGPAANKDANSQGYKDQYCTDPRTMRKHAAYTEWADAYSCTRHRCQPGGRNLAIYTVGCKRVEAPESAIECEEVVEDTNMQFPFCCTRLRCLVVVRGEVWTRVLGQPWEVLPAAPWSHMYKMKKPPPTDTPFQPKANEAGPVYELSEPETETGHDKQNALRSARKQASTDSPDCNEVVPRAALPPAPAPDIVIALSTNNEKELTIKKPEMSVRHKRGRKSPEPSHYFDREEEPHDTEMELEEIPAYTEKVKSEEWHERRPRVVAGAKEPLPDPAPPTDSQQPPETSEESVYASAFNAKEKQPKGSHQIAWTEIPQNQWNEADGMDVEPRANVMELRYTQEPIHPQADLRIEPKVEKKEDKGKKPNNLQALVDAIGTRMRDIENVVQRMSEKVHQTKSPADVSSEKRTTGEMDHSKRHKLEPKDPPKSKHDHDREHTDIEDDHFKQRFSVRSRGSKYLHGATDSTSEQPLYIEDNGNYFSDASNSVRRANQPKEPAASHPTYMAPVETHRRSPAHIAMVSDTSEDQEQKNKKKKHSHKKRKSKTHAHKKHHNSDKRKHFNKLVSNEVEKTVVSSEDSSALNN